MVRNQQDSVEGLEAVVRNHHDSVEAVVRNHHESVEAVVRNHHDSVEAVVRNQHDSVKAVVKQIMASCSTSTRRRVTVDESTTINCHWCCKPMAAWRQCH